ncbi:MAG: ChaN family lipoprotein [Magnetococcales bacterium]|nr:ChaN family lipoprotein [Magnetococcales bacterium]
MIILPLLLSMILLQWSFMAMIPIDEDVILRLSDRAPVTVEQMADQLAMHRIVLVGESHDNPAHHAIQLNVIRQLQARALKLAVAMEMFPRHLQPQLDRWVAGELTEEAFLDAVEWYFTWGFDAELYLPILRYARDQKIPLLAMNIRRETVSAVRKKGLAGLEIETRDTLPPMCPAPLGHRIRLEEVFQSHPMMSATGNFDYFVEAHSVWDGVMADALKKWSDAHPGGLVVGLAGAGHIMMGYGIPHQLRQRGVEDWVTLLPWSVGDSWIDPQAADFAWGTPETKESSPPMQLGITMDDKRQDGVWVLTVVEDSLAAKGGIRAKDRVLRFNDREVTSRHALVRMVRGLPHHEREVRVVLERDGKEEEVLLAIY